MKRAAVPSKNVLYYGTSGLIPFAVVGGWAEAVRCLQGRDGIAFYQLLLLFLRMTLKLKTKACYSSILIKMYLVVYHFQSHNKAIDFERRI